MYQAIRHLPIVTCAILLGLMTVFVSLLQPIPPAFAQQLTKPAIGISPTRLFFTAQLGGSTPAAQTLTINNTGAASLRWGVSHDAPWLWHTPGTGTGAGTVTIGVIPGSLSAGTYSGQVTLWPTGAPSVTVPVAFTVMAAPVPPALGVSPTSLSFTAQQGGSNPPAQTMAITNKGGGTLTWSVSDNASWLAPSPASGTGNGVATISMTTGSLTAGTYTGLVTLSATGAPSVTVPVTYIITPIVPSPSTSINLSPSSLSYSATQGAANPANQNISLTTTGGTVNWTVSDDASWLTVNLASGSGSSTLTTSVNTAGVPVGTHNGTITVTAAGTSSKTIAATLTVNASATSSTPMTWSANRESDLAGYKIYRATSSGGYGAAIATLQGNVTTYTASGLQSGTTYFFVITAYDLSGNESLYSNEISKSIF
ncbi:MAG: fibronectin type III domain-containing protein [Nitrospirota bacterium]